jgi:MSHA biogenesis protein MshI
MGVWLTDIAIDGSSRRIELAGASIGAELVPEYLERLGSDAALAEQTFERLEIERADDGSVRFRVTSKAVADGRRGEHAAGSAR